MARFVLLALVALGCASTQVEAPDPSPHPAPDRAAENPWSACYSGFRSGGNPKGDVARLSRTCGAHAGLRPITPVRAEYQRQGDPAHRYTFYVDTPGSCYRVFAAGDAQVKDLDLLLRGPDGEDVAADLSHDAWPVLPPHGPLCFDHPGLYMLEVSVFQGSGYYAVQIWGR